MERKTFTQIFFELPLYAQIVLIIFLGGLIGGIIRIERYLETKNNTTLIAGLVWACLGDAVYVPKIIDLITLIANKKITLFYE